MSQTWETDIQIQDIQMSSSKDESKETHPQKHINYIASKIIKNKKGSMKNTFLYIRELL